MNGRKYLMQLKLKKDKERFTRKLYLSNQINFFTTQIKSFSSKIANNRNKRNIATTHSENGISVIHRKYPLNQERAYFIRVHGSYEGNRWPNCSQHRTFSHRFV